MNVAPKRASQPPAIPGGDELSKEAQEILYFFTSEMLSAHDELLKRSRALEEANHRLQEIDQLKTRLVGDVAHELRSPLASMMIKLDLIERGNPDSRARHVEDMRRQVRRLSTMIENILDLTRIYMSNPAERFTDIDLNELVEGVVEQHRPSAQTAGLTLIWKPEPQLPQVRGEREHLERAFANLVNNAIKYTPQGTVIVASGWDAETCRVYVDVQDTGLGIEPRDLPMLFSRFHRGRQAEAANIPGTGLGLAIVKEIVDLHSGEVQVQTKLNEGSRFRTLFHPIAP
ncbi:MAG: HAMP domain-containing histidine kinase [Anaerolineae bacterium]|nr:HAMP domain-containing histidine kinase [Anaerolineae bacterium]